MKKIISTVLVCVLLFGCMLTLASCGSPNTDYKKAAEALESEGYTVTVKENTNGFAATVYAEKEDVKKRTLDSIELFYYSTEADAEAAYAELEAAYEKEAESKKGTDSEISYGLDGVLIYKGTVDAVKAAK